MTIALVMAVAAAAVAVLRGGSLDRLAATTFRWLPLLFGALAVQVIALIWDPPWLSEAGALAIVLGSMVGVAVFLTINRHLAGTLIAAVGLTLNVLVIAANGAMPVSAEAARIAGTDPAEIGGIKHEPMDEDTALRWLGDIIAIPRWTVISIGDVILGVGLATLTYHRTRHGEHPGAPQDRGRRSRSRDVKTGAPRRGRRSPATSRDDAPSRRDARGGDSGPGAPPAPPPSPRRPG